jgi:HNH endonuclease
MRNPRRRLPKRVEKLIFQEASSRCAFCGERSISTLEIHHIYALETGGSDAPENLILVCATCHDKIEGGEIRHSSVLATKAQLTGRTATSAPALNGSNVVNIHGGNSGVVANVIQTAEVRITGRRRAPRIEAPPDVIGADGDKRSYAKHLIDRYLEFKRAEVGAAMKYSIIYTAIKREFGSKWDFVSLARFDDLVTFLQKRIDQTVLGRNLRSQGRGTYSTFEEYVATRRGTRHDRGSLRLV